MVLLVYIIIEENPIYLFCSRSGDVVNRLESVLVIGGFRVECIL